MKNLDGLAASGAKGTYACWWSRGYTRGRAAGPPAAGTERARRGALIGARYAHVTATMRQRLIAGLTRQWEEALAARRELSLRSPVAVLDALLRG